MPSNYSVPRLPVKYQPVIGLAQPLSVQLERMARQARDQLASSASVQSKPSSTCAASEGKRLPTPSGAAAPGSTASRRPAGTASCNVAALPLAEIEPNQRFMGCDAADLRLGEVAELLEEYRRLASALVSVKQAQAAGVGLGV